MARIDPPSPPREEEPLTDDNIQILSCRSREKPQWWMLRWAFRPDWGFPQYWDLQSVMDDHKAPWPLSLPTSGDAKVFQDVVKARRPATGPYFSDSKIEQFEDLRLLVRLADPKTEPHELFVLTKYAANFFGDSYQADPELLVKFHRRMPSSLAELPNSSWQWEKELIIQYYKNLATGFLLTLALRFEYAAMLGLAMVQNVGSAERIRFYLRGVWGTGDKVGHAWAKGSHEYCLPSPPAWLRDSYEPATIYYPLLRYWQGWTPPHPLCPVTPDGEPLPAEALVPRSPAMATALTWAAEPDGGKTLIDHGAVLYKISRYAHGRDSAHAETLPAQPPSTAFTQLVEGELIQPNHVPPYYADTPETTGEAFEGYYHYEIRGVDLFGNISNEATYASIRHRNEISPPAPRVHAKAEKTLTFLEHSADIKVPLTIDWDALEDFNGPNTVEFRIAAQWTPLEAFPVSITDVRDVDVLHAEVSVRGLAGVYPDQLIGARLSVLGAEHPIVTHTVGHEAVLQMYKIGSRLPPNAVDGLIFATGRPNVFTPVGIVPRRKAIPATISAIETLTPLRIALTPVSEHLLPTDEQVRIYLHLFRTTVTANRGADGQWWQIVTPIENESEVWSRWLALDNPTDALLHSPAIIYPPHEVTISVPPPTTFTAGLLTLAVTAADDATYINSPTLPAIDSALIGLRGNESASTEITLSVRKLSKPYSAPMVQPWHPEIRLWATSAANYAEFSEFELRWDAGSNAVRYEVWRTLEGAIHGVNSQTTDTEFYEQARQQHDAWLQSSIAGNSNGTSQVNPFELRSYQVFGRRFIDKLPGRVPTRALYRIRSIDIAGNLSSFSDMIGPVYVPDIRQPLKPNLLRVVAATPTEMERAIVLEWTQAGAMEDLRFDIFYRPADASSTEQFILAGSIPRNTISGLGGRYRFVHHPEPLGLPPGKKYLYYVVAVREALDPNPVDSVTKNRRDIASPPSNQQIGFAITTQPQKPPQLISATYATDTGQVTITWKNQDYYEAVEVRRKAAGRYNYQRITRLTGDGEQYMDTGLLPGVWLYQLCGLGFNRETKSEVLEVRVP